jgi:hypothetical protein
MNAVQRSLCSIVILGPVLGGLGCSAPSDNVAMSADFAAISPESEALDIAAWQVDAEPEGLRLIGLDTSLNARVEALAAPAADTESVELRFSLPEAAMVHLFPDGRIEGDASEGITALTRAIYADLRAPAALPVAGESTAPTGTALPEIGSVQQALTTSSGSFSIPWSFFGVSEVRIRGPRRCPNGERRVSGEAHIRAGGGTCEFDGFHVPTDAFDCRIRVEVHIRFLSEGTCDFSVLSD